MKFTYIPPNMTGFIFSTKEPVFPRVTSPVLWIVIIANLFLLATHLRDRTPKHEHLGEANKDFADDFCFHSCSSVGFVGFFFLLPVYCPKSEARLRGRLASPR